MPILDYEQKISYIIPLILNKLEYKNYYLRFDVDHLKEQVIKDFKLTIKSDEDIIEERDIPKSELQKEERNTAFFTKEIPFNSDAYNTINLYVEYVVIEKEQEKRQKEKITIKIETKEKIGFRYWWAMMSV